MVVVVNSPHQSPRCGVSRFRSVQSMTIALPVWSVLISPALRSRKSVQTSTAPPPNMRFDE